MHCGSPLDRPSALQEGAAATTPALRGEHRVVTVMFVDIVGSTRLARSLGAESWHALLGDFFALAAEVIEGGGGSINQYTGDGFMALFGAPKALEDHALQASLAALHLRQRIGSLAQQMRVAHAQNFAVRTGLNSGPVVVGAIADDWRRDYTAQGETVHLAARMEQLAPPGCILLAERTAALLRERLQLRAGTPLLPKGMEQPVAVFELLDSREEFVDIVSADGGTQPPLIGREDILAALGGQQGMLRRDAQHAALFWLRAEPGMGKTRIGREVWNRWSQLPGRHWLPLRCMPVSQAQARPLTPIRNMLLRWLVDSPGLDLASTRQAIAARIALDYPQLTDLLPLLLEFLGLSEGRSDSGGVADKQWAELPHSLCQALGTRRLLLWVDDWHALDTASRSFLHHWLMELGAHGGGLALVSSRPEPLPEWFAGQRFQVQELAPLNPMQMRDLLAALVAPWANYSDYGRTLLAKAEGNPLFLSEAVAHAVQQGRLCGPSGQREWCGGVQDWELPDSVQALLASRMESAGRWAAELLSIAALIGRNFSQAWLAIAAQQSEQALVQPLQELARAGLLQAHPQRAGFWRFSQGLMQEVAAHRLLQTQRRECLQSLAGALQQQLLQAEIGEEVWAQVADFWAAAECWEAATEASLAAGHYWMRQRLSEGLRWYRQALDWARRIGPGHRQAELEQSALFSLLQSTSLGGADASSITTWVAQATRLTQARNQPLRAAELHIIRSTHWLNAGATRQAYRLIRQACALALQHPEGGQELLGRFRVPLLFAHFLRGDIRGGLLLFDRLDDGAWRAGRPHADNYLSRGFYALLMAAAGQLQEAIGELESVHQFATEHMSPVSWIAGNLVELYIQAGQHDRHPLLATEAMQIAQDFGSPLFLAVALRAQSLSMQALGEPQRGWRLLEQHAQLPCQPGPAQVYATALLDARAQLAHAVDDPDAAQEAIEQAWTSAWRRGELYWQARVLVTQLGLTAAPDMRLQKRAQRLISVTGAQQLAQSLPVQAELRV